MESFERSGKRKKEKKKKWFGPFPSLNVFSNSCVQFPRFLRPRNAPCLSVECSCTMRVSSKHVSILLLRLSRIITFVCLRLFFEVICGNKFVESFLVRVIHKISSKSKLYDLFLSFFNYSFTRNTDILPTYHGALVILYKFIMKVSMLCKFWFFTIKLGNH